MQYQRLLYKMLWLIGNVYKFIVGWYSDLLFYLHMFVPCIYAWYNIFNLFRSHLLTELLWLSVVTTSNEILSYVYCLFQFSFQNCQQQTCSIQNRPNYSENTINLFCSEKFDLQLILLLLSLGVYLMVKCWSGTYL